MQYLVITTHYNDAEQVLSGIPEGKSLVPIVERVQRNLRRLGRSDGVSWQAGHGDIVSALVASRA